MQIILATSNRGKVREIAELFDGDEVIPYTEIIGPLEIEETGKSFGANALIKARTVFGRLGRDDAIVLSDDSGISVPVLGGEPGIYSARYAGAGADDRQNLRKLLDALKERGVKETPAYYTAAVAIVAPGAEYLVHGWMHGTAIDTPRGEGGFGYDPMFVPEGYDRTLGELDPAIKRGISHRGRALALARPIVAMLRRLHG